MRKTHTAHIRHLWFSMTCLMSSGCYYLLLLEAFNRIYFLSNVGMLFESDIDASAFMHHIKTWQTRWLKVVSILASGRTEDGVKIIWFDFKQDLTKIWCILLDVMWQVPVICEYLGPVDCADKCHCLYGWRVHKMVFVVCPSIWKSLCG